MLTIIMIRFQIKYLNKIIFVLFDLLLITLFRYTMSHDYLPDYTAVLNGFPSPKVLHLYTKTLTYFHCFTHRGDAGS